MKSDVASDRLLQQTAGTVSPAKIRNYESSDAEALANLVVRSIAAIGPRHYTAEQVTAWIFHAPDATCLHLRASSSGRTTLVAVDETDNPIAFVDLEPSGHIDLLYCAPEFAGTGLMSALYDELEVIAHGSKLLSHRLYSEASEAAQRFFLKKGFVVTSKHELEISGVHIHNYTVEKQLFSQIELT